MITDGELYSLSVFLGSMAMLLTVAYHYLEVNAKSDTDATIGSTTVTAEAKKSKVAS